MKLILYLAIGGMIGTRARHALGGHCQLNRLGRESRWSVAIAGV
jgi:hypothetical protein